LAEGGTHAGLLFWLAGTDRPADWAVLDLQWHGRLRSSPLGDTDRFGCVLPDLLDEEAFVLRQLCSAIARRNPWTRIPFVGPREAVEQIRIPYAFRWHPDARFAPDGRLVLGLLGAGLTCSSFVLTVFRSARIDLVDFTTWEPRADDDLRHEQLLAQLDEDLTRYRQELAGLENRVSLDEAATARRTVLQQRVSDLETHIPRCRAELPCCRVRPEEVAGAGLVDSSDRPVAFPVATAAGRLALDLLIRHAIPAG
jgi:hypothetical protein